MIEKVVSHIDELDQPHLKLMVMHNFMWVLIEELMIGTIYLNIPLSSAKVFLSYRVTPEVP